jgi:superfamily II DNA or RNA helicase
MPKRFPNGKPVPTNPSNSDSESEEDTPAPPPKQANPTKAVTNPGAAGIAYEHHAISQFTRRLRKPNMIVFKTIPDGIQQILNGSDAHPRDILAAKNEAIKATRAMKLAKERGNAGCNEPPPSISRVVGADAVVVERDALIKDGSSEAIANSIKVVEAKVGVADLHVIGPTMGVAHRFMAMRSKQLPVILLSPHKPTPMVFSCFNPRNTKTAFKHIRIEEKKELPHPSAVTADAPNQTKLVELYPWQSAAVRMTQQRWNPREACDIKRLLTACMPTGMGKTVYGWATLQGLEKKQPFRIFCAHTVAVAHQIREAAKQLGLFNVHDLAHTRHTEGSIVPTRTAFDESESDDGDDESGDEDSSSAVPIVSAKKVVSERLVPEILDIANAATSDNPVYAVVTHRTLAAFFTSGAAPVALKVGMAIVLDEFHKISNCGDIFRAIMDTKRDIRCLCVTATLPKLISIGAPDCKDKEGQKYIENAPSVMHKTMADGIALGMLVPIHVEVVLAVDPDTNSILDSVDLDLEKKAMATADWIVANNLSSVSVYCKRQVEATKAARAIQSALQARLPDADVWTSVVHSGRGCTASGNLKALQTFKGEDKDGNYTDYDDGCTFKVITSVNMLKEGFDFAPLKAVVVFDPPKDVIAATQTFGRVTRSDGGKKTVGGVLIFGDENAANIVSKMRVNSDPKGVAITYGVIPNDYNNMVLAQGGGGAGDDAESLRKALKQRDEMFHSKVTKKVEHLVTVIAGPKEVKRAQVKAYCNQFKHNKPGSATDVLLVYELKGVKISINAYDWCRQASKLWNDNTLPEEFKEYLSNNSSFVPIPPLVRNARKSMSLQEKLLDTVQFAEQHKRYPVSSNKECDVEGQHYNFLNHSFDKLRKSDNDEIKTLLVRLDALPKNRNNDQLQPMEEIVKFVLEEGRLPMFRKDDRLGTKWNNFKGGTFKKENLEAVKDLVHQAFTKAGKADALKNQMDELIAGLKSGAEKPTPADRQNAKRKAVAPDAGAVKKAKVHAVAATEKDIKSSSAGSSSMHQSVASDSSDDDD